MWLRKADTLCIRDKVRVEGRLYTVHNLEPDGDFSIIMVLTNRTTSIAYDPIVTLELTVPSSDMIEVVLP